MAGNVLGHALRAEERRFRLSQIRFGVNFSHYNGKYPTEKSVPFTCRRCYLSPRVLCCGVSIFEFLGWPFCQVFNTGGESLSCLRTTGKMTRHKAAKRTPQRRIVGGYQKDLESSKKDLRPQGIQKDPRKGMGGKGASFRKSEKGEGKRPKTFVVLSHGGVLLFVFNFFLASVFSIPLLILSFSFCLVVCVFVVVLPLTNRVQRLTRHRQVGREGALLSPLHQS